MPIKTNVLFVPDSSPFHIVLNADPDFSVDFEENQDTPNTSFAILAQERDSGGNRVAPQLKTADSTLYPCRVGIFPAAVADGITVTTKGILLESNYSDDDLYGGLMQSQGSETIKMGIPRNQQNGSRFVKFTDLSPFKYALVRTIGVQCFTIGTTKYVDARTLHYFIIPFSGNLTLPPYTSDLTDPDIPDVTDNQGGTLRTYKCRKIPTDGRGQFHYIVFNGYQLPNDSRSNMVTFRVTQEGQTVGNFSGRRIVNTSSSDSGTSIAKEYWLTISVQEFDFEPRVTYNYSRENLIRTQYGATTPVGGRSQIAEFLVISGYFDGTLSSVAT